MFLRSNCYEKKIPHVQKISYKRILNQIIDHQLQDVHQLHLLSGSTAQAWAWGLLPGLPKAPHPPLQTADWFFIHTDRWGQKWFFAFFIKLILLGVGFLYSPGAEIGYWLDKECQTISFYYWKSSNIPKVPSSGTQNGPEAGS